MDVMIGKKNKEFYEKWNMEDWMFLFFVLVFIFFFSLLILIQSV